MGIRIETWNIAFRKKCNGLFDKRHPFTIIKNGYKGWYADPFLFEYEKETYLFAEFFSYRLNRGLIVCSKYDNQRGDFTKFQEIINEDFHLSYPVVFEFNNKIYMLPEASESNALYLYESIAFPYEWKRLEPVMDGLKLVDTTPIIVGDKLYALSLRLRIDNHELGDLVLLEFNGKTFDISKQGILTDDMSIARPGGEVIREHDRFYRVSQNCEEDYGRNISISELSKDFIIDYSEKIIKTITPDEINVKNSKKACGVHTYNRGKKIEVIDLKFYKNVYTRVLYRIPILFKK